MDDQEDIPLNVAFPLPFQILALIGLAVFGWATNLHLLDLAGIDVVSSLDLTPNALPAHHNVPRPTSSLVALYRAVYRIFVVYSALCFVAWSAYRYTTHGDVGLVDLFGYIPCIAAISVVFLLFCPSNVLHKTERRRFLHAIRRCLISSWDDPIHFSDIILADIFTSFAQVIGDVWLSLCMLIPGHSILNPSAGVGMSRWILPTVMSFPYLVRLRQCVIESSQHKNDSRRPLYNAIKYATAFPVIYLSAAQPRVVEALHAESADSPWHGENRAFRLWLLAALIHSLYSFWWDVTNDWGFNLLKLPPEDSPRSSPTRPVVNRLHPNTPRRRSFDDAPIPSIEQPRSRKEHSIHQRKHRDRYGLRSTLHFPVVIYPLSIALDLLLRLIWSMKLFSVVNVKSHAGLANFALKIAELFRRWVWVFVRVEWEMIKKGHDSPMKGQTDDEQYELTSSGMID